MNEEYSQSGALGARICNTISLLVPAYQYQIKCAWTKEVSLPAVEEFACRLLLAMQEILPGEIKEYFGLSKRECEVLVETLVSNKLAVYTNDGYLAPSSMLTDRTKGSSVIAPSLTKYEDRIEKPVFELLTRTIMPTNRYNRSRYGLPEIPVPEENKGWSTHEVAEAFGRQYRAFLDFSRMPEHEVRKTRLYKVGTCDQAMAMQIPVDMNVELIPQPTGAVQIHKGLAERQGDTRQRPLTMEMEAKVSDYLGQLRIPEGGLSLVDFCKLFNDNVLEKYIDERGLDMNSWLQDHHSRKTGYGSPLTRAMIGPIYQHNNRLTIQRTLTELERDWSDDVVHHALWLSSSVPLWAASGTPLSDFCRKISEDLSVASNTRGKITALFQSDDSRVTAKLKRDYHNRIPNGIVFLSGDLQDRLEIFIIPGQLAVIQYHVQPSADSAITVPIGYMTHDPERLALIDAYLNERLSGCGEPIVAWSDDGESDPAKFMETDRLKLLDAKQIKPLITVKRSPKKW